jgi:gliding motility-associated-like protein
MKKFFFILLLFLFNFFSLAQPGKDGTLTVSLPNQILNKYIPVSTNIAASSNTVTIANASLFSLCPGDLIMIYQAQGANIDITNTNAYGNITAYNSAGLYEFKYVQSVNGNTVTTQTTFTNSYAVAGRVQLIKVPQYTTLTVNLGASIIPKNWKDTSIAATPYRFGGLVVIHASTIINNGTISSSGSGFRGGAIFYSGGLNLGNTAIRSTMNNQGGEKGESIFGYQTDYDVNGGRYCLGAPANAGGGGNGHNAGGGGGGNGFNSNLWTGQGVMIVNGSNLLGSWSLSAGYISNGNALTNSSGGGHGGYSYGDANANATIQGPGNPAWVGDTRREVGGIGGRPLTNINSETRIYFGGGGGAPHADNNATTAGANGGGIVYLIATTGITGVGNLSSIGNTAGNSTGCSCDGSAGAGAGGSIILKTGAIVASQIVNANGGNGGNQLFPVSPSNPNESEGPGGGGGGGFVAISTGAIIPNVNGGLNGTSLSNAVAGEMTSNGATQGAAGQIGPVTTNFVSFTPLSSSTYSASNNGPLCAGSTLVLTTTATALSYTWTGPNSATSTSQSYSITNVTPAVSGIYSVQINFGNCLAPGSATTLVTINPSPTINLSGSSVCTGQSIILNPSVTTATSYVWSGPNNFSSSFQTFTISNATVNNSGTYSLVVTNSLGCTTSASANVSVTATPTPVLLSNAPFCPGSSLNFTTTGATTYTVDGPNGFSSSIQNPTVTNITSAASGIYTLTATNSACSATTTLNVTINPAPSPSISLNNNQLCEGQYLNLSGSGGVSYVWIGPSSFTSNIQNPSINPATINSSGYYTLTVASANGCTASTISQSITISPTPTVIASNVMVCINQPVNLNANSLGSSFLWSGPNSFSSAAQTVSLGNASFNLSGTYNLTVTSVQGCTNTAAANVSVSPLPTPTISSNSPVCAGSNLNLNGGGGLTYLFNGPNGFSSTLQNPSIINVSAASSGIYTLTASNFGCSASTTLSVTIFGTSGGTITISDTDRCVPFCSTLSVNTNGAPVLSTTLSVNGQLFLGNTINYCITTAGNYTIGSSFKDNDGCINTSTISVIAYPKPNADFLFSPLKPVENIDEVIFTNTSTGVNQTNWNWFFNSNNGYTSSNQNTSYLFENSGSYPVAMIVKNGWGCSDTIVKMILIENEYSLYVPNAFTPDGDGINDVFIPKGVGILKYDLTIFDRWGEQVFKSTDFFKGWDGSFKGKPCQTGTYIWMIHANIPSGKSKEYVGHVTLYK